jgi:hypothetical protein
MTEPTPLENFQSLIAGKWMPAHEEPKVNNIRAALSSIPAMEQRIKQADHDWLFLARECSMVDDLISSPSNEWGQADDTTLNEEYDPHQTLKKALVLIPNLRSQLLAAQAEAERLAELAKEMRYTFFHFANPMTQSACVEQVTIDRWDVALSSTTALSWLKGHDQEVLKAAWERAERAPDRLDPGFFICNSIHYDRWEGLHIAILAEREREGEEKG